MSPSQKTLKVHVNEDLTLDAGWWEEIPADDSAICRRVHPPETTMFEQVLDYLASLPREPGYLGLDIGREAIAATAVCLRWGSYLAVLADRDKPLWPPARQEGLSRIADSEMARINIEASAALAQWIDIMRNDWERYLSLMWAACRLPMTRKRAKRDRHYLHLLGLTQADVAATMLSRPRTQSEWGRRAQVDAEAHPTRVLANAIINACWRNGPIEDIHAGQTSTYPLAQRRITPSEERALIRTTADRMAQGILAIFGLIHERSERTWAERVLPFNLVPELLVTPSDWSLDERTRQVWLPGVEEGAVGNAAPGPQAAAVRR
jgi:hypothetical protein